MHHQFGHRHALLRQGQLRVWHLTRHEGKAPWDLTYLEPNEGPHLESWDPTWSLATLPGEYPAWSPSPRGWAPPPPHAPRDPFYRACPPNPPAQALEPYPKKLGTDTWFYAKRAFLALADTLAKHMILLKDATFNEIISFLDAVDMHGKNIPTKVQDHPDKPVDTARCNVSVESRILKKMFIKLR